MDYYMNRERFCLVWNTHVTTFLLLYLPPNRSLRRDRKIGVGTESSVNNSFHLPLPIASRPYICPSASSSFPTAHCFHIMIMKSSHILLFCVLATASYVIFYQHFSVSSSLHFLPGRRHVREWGLPFSNSKSEYQKIQEVGEGMKRSTMQEDSSAVEQMSRSESSEENVYHIDYHGVMTHPTPTPKHPQP